MLKINKTDINSNEKWKYQKKSYFKILYEQYMNNNKIT